jgi:hypothetical protein
MKRALIKDLHRVAKQRGDGYLETCLKAGKISRDGQWMIFNDAAHTKIRHQFNPRADSSHLSRRVPLRHHIKIGLGDALHAKLGPIGRAIGWPCMKGDGTIDLKPNSLCARLRRAANKITMI